MRALTAASIGIVSLLVSVSSGAGSLLGRNYIAVTSSATWLGDDVLSERYDYLNRLGASANFNLHPHVDARLGASSRSDERTYGGVTYDGKDNTAQASLRGFYNAKDRVMPYAECAYIDSQDAWSIGVWAGRWCWEKILIGMSWSYKLTEEDMTGAITFVYAFR